MVMNDEPRTLKLKIKDDADYKKAKQRVYDLMQLDLEPYSEEDDELEWLSLLVEEYEKEHFPILITDAVKKEEKTYSNEEQEQFIKEWHAHKKDHQGEGLPDHLKEFFYKNQNGKDCLISSFLKGVFGEGFSLENEVKDFLKEKGVTVE